jgi:hypothetical protein
MKITKKSSSMTRIQKKYKNINASSFEIICYLSLIIKIIYRKTLSLLINNSRGYSHFNFLIPLLNYLRL